MLPPERVVEILPGRQVAALPSKYDLERLRYRLDWTPCLAGDAITGADVVVASGAMTIDPESVVPDAEGVTFRIGAGRPGNDSTIQCVVDTASGDTLEAVLTCRCLEPTSKPLAKPPATSPGTLDATTPEGTGELVGAGIL